MSSLNELYNAGKKDIWENASVAQLRYLQIIAKLRRVETSLLKQCDMLFIPNDEYLALHCGKDIKQYEYGCYLQSDVCIWTGHLLIPIRDVAGYVRGFAGFHPFHYAEAKETEDKSITYYSYSAKDVFPKSKYLYCPGNCYERAIKDGYIFLVDGIFDAASLWYAGFNAAALMGSIPTEYILMQLRFIRRVILISDNDEAGYRLYINLKRQLDNVALLKQGGTKDADELLKSKKREEFVQLLKTIVLGDDLIRISVF
ncbi:toprim domain-containing protein [Lachnospiraceae bacterium 47-T17]